MRSVDQDQQGKSLALNKLEGALALADRSYLIALSRKTLECCAVHASLPKVPESELTPGLCLKNHCFVTLRIGEALRGCIGSIALDEMLYRRVIESTESAAMEDPRFSPVRPDEVKRVNIHISILTESRVLEYEGVEDLLGQLIPNRHGVIIRCGWQAATYLPQVWEHVPQKEQFLSELCLKARLRPDAWRGSDVSIEVFESLSIGER